MFETSKPIVGLYIQKGLSFRTKTLLPTKGISIFLKVWTVILGKNGQLKLIDHTDHDHMLVMIEINFKG